MAVEVKKKTMLHQGRIFRLMRENITLENGVNTDMDVIRHPGAAAVVPFVDENTLLMIRQYRYAAGGYIWEIPAGTLDPGETPQTCAERELIEEVGFSGGTWRFLGEITPLPGYSDECIHIFAATDLTPAHQHLDHDEILEVHKVGFQDALEMIRNNEIQDAKTISGLFLAKLRMKD